MRIFLVGANEGFARSLARFLDTEPRCALAGVAPSLSIARLLLSAAQPHLVLLHWTALNGVASEAIQALRAHRTGLRIACVASEREPYRAVAMRAGADAGIVADELAVELESLLPGLFPQHFAGAGARDA